MVLPIFLFEYDWTFVRHTLEVPLIALICGLVFYFGVSWFFKKRQLPPPKTRARSGAMPTAGGQGASGYSATTPSVAPFGEKRAAFRRDGNPTPVYLADIDFLDDPFDAWVIDRSLGGLCLSLQRNLAVGAILNVRSRSAPETIPWVQVEIRTCRKEEDGYNVGCRFVRTPSWSVMLHFG